MVSNEELRAGAEVLQENVDPFAAPKRKARGGKASRARRLEKFQDQRTDTLAGAAAAVPWARLVYGKLRQHRAKRHDDAQDAWIRTRCARVKIRAALWHTWTRRSLETAQPKISWCDRGRQPTGELLAPLSLRDVWIMSLAALFMKQLNVLDPDHELADPTGDRYYRHVLDWLREPTDEGYPHWEHTTHNPCRRRLEPGRVRREQRGRLLHVRRGRVGPLVRAHVRQG